MRLQRHINEVYSMENWKELSAILEKDCKPHIKDLKGVKTLLVRGYSSPTGSKTFKKRSIRTDRIPRFISQNLSDKMSAYSKKKFGWDVRREGLFCTNDFDTASNFGRPYVIFPIGNYKSVWIDDANELYDAYDGWEGIINRNIEQQRLRANKGRRIGQPKTQLMKDYQHDWDKAVDDAYDEWIEPNLAEYEKNKMNQYLKQERDGSEAIIKGKDYYQINYQWYSTLLGWFSDKYWRK